MSPSELTNVAAPHAVCAPKQRQYLLLVRGVSARTTATPGYQGNYGRTHDGWLGVY